MIIKIRPLLISAMKIFDSRKTEYKSVVSAIATNEKVKFRIAVPRAMGCTGATLAVLKDGEDPVYYGMI